MDALTVSLELAAIRETTRRLAVWSLVLHAVAVVVFLLLASAPRVAAEDEWIITEVTWQEVPPVPLEVAAVEDVAEAVAEAEEIPQVVIPPRDAGVDLMQQRLATLRADDAGRRDLIAAASVPSSSDLVAVASRPVPPPRDLKREGRSVATLTELPRQAPSVVAAAATSLPETEIEESILPAREIAPGVSLTGEVRNRRLIDVETPEYPEWAKLDGVEASVGLYFTVLPSGRVKENVLVERTSGYDDFDRRAEAALAAWRFESLAAGSAAEQWGRIEFNYRLRDARRASAAKGHIGDEQALRIDHPSVDDLRRRDGLGR